MAVNVAKRFQRAFVTVRNPSQDTNDAQAPVHVYISNSKHTQDEPPGLGARLSLSPLI